MKQRLRRLLAHDINLFAYHLPLDAHTELGNNAQLGRALGWVSEARFGEQDLGCMAPVNMTAHGRWRSTWARYWGAHRPWWYPSWIARWRAWPGVPAVHKAIS